MEIFGRTWAYRSRINIKKRLTLFQIEIKVKCRRLLVSSDNTVKRGIS